MNNSATARDSGGTPDATRTVPTTIQEQLAWKITPELHETIRRLWIRGDQSMPG